jgi:hypothetical protein
VEPEMYDYTSYNWSHWNGNEKLEENSVSCTGKTLGKYRGESLWQETTTIIIIIIINRQGRGLTIHPI